MASWRSRELGGRFIRRLINEATLVRTVSARGLSSGSTRKLCCSICHSTENVSDVLYVFDGFVCAVGREDATDHIPAIGASNSESMPLLARLWCRRAICGRASSRQEVAGAMDSTAGKDHVRARWARGHFRDHRERDVACLRPLWVALRIYRQ